MNNFEKRREEKAARMRELAEKHEQAAASSHQAARKMGEAIPFGQPILIGHHSEKRDRNYRARIQSKYEKAAEHQEKAKYFRGRALSIEGNTAIFSDDPNATEKLAEKIERLEARQELMRETNKLVRKKDLAGLEALGYSPARVKLLFTADFCGRIGFADYQLTNNGANIRRLKKRLELETNKSHHTTKEVNWNGVRVLDNVEENRLQLFFPGKPSDQVRTDLKRGGFRWSPMEGAWQRHRSNGAIHSAQDIIRRHYPPKLTAPVHCPTCADEGRPAIPAVACEHITAAKDPTPPPGYTCERCGGGVSAEDHNARYCPACDDPAEGL